MIPAPFDYHRPKSVDEAIGILGKFGDEARLVAGGHSLVPMMKLRMATPGHLVDLRDVGELKAIRREGDTLVIGAMTTQHELIHAALVTSACPILRETSLLIADPQVRYCGTLGGNVANGDPGNDMPAVMVALNATYRVRGAQGERDLPARAFYKGAYDTGLAEGEILTSIRIPVPPPGHGHAYEKQKRKIGDYATAAAAVILTLSGGVCSAAAIALTNVAATPLLATDAAQALVGMRIDEASVADAQRRAQAIATPTADARGPVEFRRHVAGIMVRRAILRAAQNAA
jgi:carbon-monoxide dehydrogenase medium subunit